MGPDNNTETPKADKKKSASAAQPVGVFQRKTGSYMMDGVKFLPYIATTVSQEIRNKACDATSPLAWFESLEDAARHIKILKDSHEQEARIAKDRK